MLWEISAIILFAGTTISLSFWARTVTHYRQHQHLVHRMHSPLPPSRVLPIDDLDLPLWSRIMIPLWTRLTQSLATKILPHKASRLVQQQITQAGLTWSAATFMLLRAVTALAIAASTVLMLSFIPGLPAINHALWPLGAAIVTYLLFGTRLKKRIQQRKDTLNRALPDIFDILSTCIAAGLAFDGALQRLVQFSTGVVRDEFARVIADLRVGHTRADALYQLAQRTQNEELQRFAQLITQSERAGSNISQALQIQGRHIKQVRIAAVREKAAALPVKMLFPLVFFMFPAMFVVILAPGLLKILHHF